MRLSILIPSHGADLRAYSRIAAACSLASPEIEVVLRDNSGTAAKREFLELVRNDNCNLIVAEPCGAFENFVETLQAAQGDFVFFATDNDLYFERGIAAVAEAAAAAANDPSIAGITGSYVLEERKGSQIIGYPSLDSVSMAERVSGYLRVQGPNVALYSTIRRSVALRAWNFMRAHPFKFPFHDQVVVLLYLLAGRIANVNRLTFVYDNTNWESLAKAASQDRKYYSSAGMDPAFCRLHWLVCGFEGARLAFDSRYSAAHAAEERRAAAGRWFEVMFARFAADRRGPSGSNLDSQAEALCTKWRQKYPNLNLDDLAADICGFMGLFSPEKARLYRDFWAAFSAGIGPQPAPTGQIRS